MNQESITAEPRPRSSKGVEREGEINGGGRRRMRVTKVNNNDNAANDFLRFSETFLVRLAIKSN